METEKLGISGRIAAAFQANALTPLLALRLFGSLRLAARCWDLRQQGHKINQRMIQINRKRVSVYWI